MSHIDQILQSDEFRESIPDMDAWEDVPEAQKREIAALRGNMTGIGFGRLSTPAQDTTDTIAEAAAKAVTKEWVQDPSPDAEQTRWRNTRTGEYRYQPNQPGTRSGGESDSDGAEDAADPPVNSPVDPIGPSELMRDIGSLAEPFATNFGMIASQVRRAIAFPAPPEAIARSFRQGLRANEHIRDYQTWDYVRSAVGRTLSRAFDHDPDSYEGKIDLGGVDSQFKSWFLKRRDDQLSDEQTGQLNTIASKWARGGSDDMMGEETAPLWQAAIEATGNSYMPKDKGAGSADVRPEMVEAVRVWKQHVTEAFREAFGDTVTVYRGVQDYHVEGNATDIRQAIADGESVEFRHATLSSYSTDPTIAQKFARKGEYHESSFVLTREVPVESIWFSSETSGGLYDSETEVVVGGEQYPTFTSDSVATADQFDALEEVARRYKEAAEGTREKTADAAATDTLRVSLDADAAFWMREADTEPAEKVAKDEWVPYEGPLGGEGWEHVETGEVVYQDEKPGRRSSGRPVERPADGAPAATGERAGAPDVDFADLQPGDRVLYEESFYADGDVVEAEIQDHLDPTEAAPNGSYVVDIVSGEPTVMDDEEEVIFPGDIAEVIGGPSVDNTRSSTTGPENRRPDHTDFDDLEIGQEIIYRDNSYYGEGEIEIGEVTRTWDDSERDNITVISEDGVEKPVYPTDFMRLADTPDPSPDRPPQAGDIVHFRATNGDIGRAEVQHVREDGDLWVESVADDVAMPLDPDRVVSHREQGSYYEDRRAGFTAPETHMDTPNNPSAEWIETNVFPGQAIRAYDKFEDEIREGVVRSVDGARASMAFHDDMSEDTWPLDEDTKRFDLLSAADWDELSEWRQRAAMMEHYKHGLQTTALPDEVYDEFKEQTRKNVLPAFKDADMMRRVTTTFERLRNKVDRASCGGGRYGFQMKLQRSVKPDTTNHEFGHGILDSYNYNYGSVSYDEVGPDKYEYRPWAMAHNHRELRDERGLFNFDFSKESDFLDPETYMFQTPDPVPVEHDPEDVDTGSLSDVTAVYEMDGETHEFEIERGKAFHSGGNTSVNYDRTREDGRITYKNLSFHEDGTVTYSFYEDTGEGWEEIEEKTGTLEAVKDEARKPLGADRIMESVNEELAGRKHTDLANREYERDWAEDEVAEAFAGLEAGDAVELHVANVEYGSDEVSYEIQHVVYTGNRNDREPSFTLTQSYDFDDFDEGTALRFMDDDGDAEREATVVDTGEDEDAVTIEFHDTNETAEFTREDIDQYRLRHATGGWGGKVFYHFEKPNGHGWTWGVDAETGRLDTQQGSSLMGVDYSRSEEVDNDLRVADPSEMQNPSHPLASWPGFNTAPETTAEKVENLVLACNRSWYKQAKILEEYANGNRSAFNVYDQLIGGNYAASNAHETMAKLHETLQSDNSHTAQDAKDLPDAHPWLLHAYLALFEPSEKAKGVLEQHTDDDHEFDI